MQACVYMLDSYRENHAPRPSAKVVLAVSHERMACDSQIVEELLGYEPCVLLR